MNNNKFKKYVSDVFINPSKALALLFHPPAVMIAGCAAFAIAETVHCMAHIRRAWEKENRSRAWRLTKMSLMLLRLTASWVGAVALSCVTVVGTTFVAALAAPVFPVAFFVSSCASLLHKLKGIFNHISRSDTPSFWEHINYFPTFCKRIFVKKENTSKTAKEISMDKSFQLVGRAAIGLAGTILTAMLVLFKAATLIAIASNPIGIAIGGGLLVGMMIYKSIKAYKEYNNVKSAPSPPPLPPALDTAMRVESGTTGLLLKSSPRGVVSVVIPRPPVPSAAPTVVNSMTVALSAVSVSYQRRKM